MLKSIDAQLILKGHSTHQRQGESLGVPLFKVIVDDQRCSWEGSIVGANKRHMNYKQRECRLRTGVVVVIRWWDDT